LDPWGKIVLLILSYGFVSSQIVNDALNFKGKGDLDSNMVGYSFCLGFYAFGLLGVVYGPLLYSLVWVIYEIMRRSHFEGGQIKFDSTDN
jgi:predicted PurR-regulated permease PerM